MHPPRRLLVRLRGTPCAAGASAASSPLAVLRAARARRRRAAHEIPNDVTVQAFLKPEGQRLRLLVRVPLKAMRDMDYPQRGGGSPGPRAARPSLRDAATLWIAALIELYEDDGRLDDAADRRGARRRCRPIDRSTPTTRRSRT